MMDQTKAIFVLCRTLYSICSHGDETVYSSGQVINCKIREELFTFTKILISYDIELSTANIWNHWDTDVILGCQRRKYLVFSDYLWISISE